MFVRTMLLSATGVIVAFGLTAAQAQAPDSDMSPGGPPTAAAPETSGGPAGGAASGGAMDDQQGAAGAGPSTSKGGAAEKSGRPVGQTDQTERERGSDDAAKGKTAKDPMTSEDKAAEKPGAPEGKKTPKDSAAEAPSGKTEGTADKSEGKTGTTATGDTDASAKGETGDRSRGDMDATKDESRKSGASAKIEPQHVQKIKTYFSSHRPSVTRINRTEVSVSVGIALPTTIVLYDLPPNIILVEGGCPIRYFVWGEDVVLVDSCTREVVEIIVGVA